jgi:hypothetical protein
MDLSVVFRCRLSRRVDNTRKWLFYGLGGETPKKSELFQQRASLELGQRDELFGGFSV